MRPLQTPSQTVGPFFHMRLGGAGQNVLVKAGTPGLIRIEGRVIDGQGQGVGDALVELWQADGDGRYGHPEDRWPASRDGFTGFGRATTDRSDGSYFFETIKPGRVRAPSGDWQAPHASLVLVARGLLGHLFSRVYFDDEATMNASDPVLSRVPPERRPTLVARLIGRARSPTYHHDIVLQGGDETVFFDV